MSKRPTILITGAHGNLGRELLKLYPEALFPTHKELDITDRSRIFKYISKHTPEIIIHLAAMVGVRECEENKELAWVTNVEGTKNLIDACLGHNKNTYFVYMSTACTADGTKDLYEDDIPTVPCNYYGLTKLIGELLIRFSPLKTKLIIRSNFVPRKKWRYPKAFVDRVSYYLYADTLAKCMKAVIDKKMTGIIHIQGNKKMSMYELAKLTTPEVKPFTLKEYYNENPSNPKLTKNMCLVSTRIKPFKFE